MEKDNTISYSLDEIPKNSQFKKYLIELREIIRRKSDISLFLKKAFNDFEHAEKG